MGQATSEQRQVPHARLRSASPRTGPWPYLIGGFSSSGMSSRARLLWPSLTTFCTSGAHGRGGGSAAHMDRGWQAQSSGAPGCGPCGHAARGNEAQSEPARTVPRLMQMLPTCKDGRGEATQGGWFR